VRSFRYGKAARQRAVAVHRSRLSNLLNNASKYTPAGGLIQLAGFRQADHVRIEVRDSGIGIPAEHLEHVLA
jgi:signal transduction histidine kinase